MKHTLILMGAMTCFIAPTLAQSVVKAAESDDIVIMADETPAMRAAFEKARLTLGQFLEKAASPPSGTGYYALKVGVREGKNTEYFWITGFTREGDRFSGRLDNTPRMVSNVREGQTYSFPKTHIVDWTYVDRVERRMHGNFTMCALLTQEPPAEADAAKKRFGLKCE